MNVSTSANQRKPPRFQGLTETNRQLLLQPPWTSYGINCSSFFAFLWVILVTVSLVAFTLGTFTTPTATGDALATDAGHGTFSLVSG